MKPTKNKTLQQHQLDELKKNVKTAVKSVNNKQKKFEKHQKEQLNIAAKLKQYKKDRIVAWCNKNLPKLIEKEMALFDLREIKFSELGVGKDDYQFALDELNSILESLNKETGRGMFCFMEKPYGTFFLHYGMGQKAYKAINIREEARRIQDNRLQREERENSPWW